MISPDLTAPVCVGFLHREDGKAPDNESAHPSAFSESLKTLPGAPCAWCLLAGEKPPFKHSAACVLPSLVRINALNAGECLRYDVEAPADEALNRELAKGGASVPATVLTCGGERVAVIFSKRQLAERLKALRLRPELVCCGLRLRRALIVNGDGDRYSPAENGRFRLFRGADYYVIDVARLERFGSFEDVLLRTFPDARYIGEEVTR